METGAPRVKPGPGARSNMPDFRFCEVQNRRKNAALWSEL